MGEALRRAGYGRQGINLLINDGPDSNQHVPHLHLHLSPRQRGDLAALLWRILTRFLPFGRARIQARLAREAEQLRQALKREP
jgi:histidine triad (HIT) family protein